MLGAAWQGDAQSRFPSSGVVEGSWGFCPGWWVLWLAESGGARLPVTVGSGDVAVACRG